jgi:multidrug efflux system membrane fusion protein
MKKSYRYLLIALVGVIVLIVIVAQAQQRQRTASRDRGEGPVPVLVAPATVADVPVYLDGVGTTKALNTVTVRPQVDGKLIKVSFKEGQDVERGYVLAEIDPTTYQAMLDQAKAKKAQDEALLANARLDLERYTRLGETNSIARQQVDTQRALVAQYEAQAKLDQAAIDNAQAYLDYTKIVAPLTGRTGIRLVDEGNIVRAADATGIVVITQVRPISILFSLPQQQLSRINQAFAKDALTVEALGADNRSVVDRGILQVVDNQVDQTTGTVKLKAEFPNSDLQLWPGQFVNVRLLIDTLRNVVVIPTAAVQRGPGGTFVFVIQNDDVVSVRPVTVMQQDDVRAVIATGLLADERVVTTGFARLADGSKVTVASAEDQPLAPIGPAPGGKRRGGGK